MAHKGHPLCPYTSKQKCEAARRHAIGPCVALLDNGERECRNYGTDTVDGRAYCGVHVMTPYREADERKRLDAKKAELHQRIDEYLKATGQDPHDCGDSCPYSSLEPLDPILVPQPRHDEIHWTSPAIGVDTVTGVTVRWTDRGYVAVDA